MRRRWQIVGMVLQAAVLGTLVFIAVARLTALQTGARVFYYQMF